MFLITRKPGEDFLLSDDTRLTIVSAHGGLVRFRIDNARSKLASDGEITIPHQGTFGIFYLDKTSDETVNLFPQTARDTLSPTEVIMTPEIAEKPPSHW
ncbi:carbon storage regulator [Zavarzinella formosa]|uniref:carbon storage regulator n=1 Tax=Zavarzinella formosa TaxID=360055 RepID=UPI0002D66DE0|nr:carbon storage regulator [Zavarzinella formosa]